MRQKKQKQDPYEDLKEHEVDVDRMINEGLAGGTVHSAYDRMQIGETRKLPKENEPFPDES